METHFLFVDIESLDFPNEEMPTTLTGKVGWENDNGTYDVTRQENIFTHYENSHSPEPGCLYISICSHGHHHAFIIGGMTLVSGIPDIEVAAQISMYSIGNLLYGDRTQLISNGEILVADLTKCEQMFAPEVQQKLAIQAITEFVRDIAKIETHTYSTFLKNITQKEEK